jgi:hypothetical protein
MQVPEEIDACIGRIVDLSVGDRLRINARSVLSPTARRLTPREVGLPRRF